VSFDVRLLRFLDKVLVLVVVALTTVGIAMISSAAPSSTNVTKQLIAAGIGAFLLLVALLFDYEEFTRMTWVIYGVNVLLLVAVLAVGKLTNGAQSWIALGPIQFQPSEFGKVMLILTLGNQLSQMERLETIWDLIPPALHVAPLLGLLLLQPDLGTALVFVAITAAMVYMAGFPGWKLALLGGGPIAAVAAWFYAHVKWGISMWPLLPHQVERLRTFVNPMADPTGAGYQVIQSKITIGSGGLWGKGLHHGTQSQLGFLPEQHTDFIFSVLGEELGFVGGAAVILLFLILLWRIMTIAAASKDKYGTLIATGVAAMIGFHVLENIGMTLGLMPVTGIPLPFISYGGTALMANMLAIGLVLSVGMRRQKLMF
jgi:rod shape determining protein RodA